ncbi:hypothetical protein ABNQ38_14535 (plasmid) [Azospirillum sp. A29]|uniref:hypothetical protein n=1 Tax=Azospirillum sp. A29 TaxID=3160606 RepID=UPI00366B9615
MHHDKLLCLNIETMPDRQILPPHCHQIVAISFVEVALSTGRSRCEQVLTPMSR